MLAILSLLLIVGVSIVLTRVATVALTHTGISSEMARFQARSAFTGVGFTTDEAETVMRHPVRRRIIMWLMLLGNVGIMSALASLVLSFVDDTAASWPYRLLLLFAGVAFLWAMAASQLLDRWMHRIISRALARFSNLDVRDYARLLRLRDEYTITELRVEERDWLARATLADLSLRDEGVIVLGITRHDGAYLGAPKGHTRILPGDSLLLYGRESLVHSLDQRMSGYTGEVEHRQAVSQQEAIVAEQQHERDEDADGSTGKQDEDAVAGTEKQAR